MKNITRAQKKTEAKTKDATDTAHRAAEERGKRCPKKNPKKKKNDMYAYDEALSHVHRLLRIEGEAGAKEEEEAEVM